MRRRSAFALALAVVSCGSSPATSVCAPGGALDCACSDGSPGSTACLADGTGFEACSCHGSTSSNGGGNGTGGAGAGGRGAGGVPGCAETGDPLWSQVHLYISCDSTIQDASGKSTITLHNTPTPLPTQGAPGGSACHLGNAGAYGTANGFDVVLPTNFGSDDFTVEFTVLQTAWNDPSDANSQILIARTGIPPGVTDLFPSFWSSAGTPGVQFAGGSITYLDQGAMLDRWESYAASRVAGTTRVFGNGEIIDSFSDSSSYSDTGFAVSYQANGPYNAVMGAITRIRITHAGRYTSTYTPCPGAFATSP